MTVILDSAVVRNLNGVALDCYKGDDDGDFWATREQIGQLLGYSHPRQALEKIHKRNADRLNKFSTVVKMGTVEGSRTVEKDGEVWFVGKDVAEALGYEKPRNAIQKYVEGEDKITLSNLDEPQNRAPLNGLPDNMTLINEPGVYSLIFSSKLPSAKQFKRWVTHEVLPDIIKHGMYMSDKLRALRLASLHREFNFAVFFLPLSYLPIKNI